MPDIVIGKPYHWMDPYDANRLLGVVVPTRQRGEDSFSVLFFRPKDNAGLVHGARPHITYAFDTELEELNA